MSALSGIGVSEQLTQVFSASVSSSEIRFLKVTIWDDSLVPSSSLRAKDSFEDDLDTLQELLSDDTPAYVLARLDGENAGWLAISYIPDVAKVRDKMLYASTRNALTKALGTTHFTDTLFATSKADLTAAAYRAHRAHIAAPPPLSRAEQEMEAVRAAELQASTGASGTADGEGASGSGPVYEGMRARRNHVGTGAMFGMSEEVEEAVRGLGEGNESRLVVLSVDPATETLVLTSSNQTSADEVGASLPSSEPSYSFFAWTHSHGSMPRRDIVFIYACPAASPVKRRMLYSSGALAVHRAASALLPSPDALLARKIETSDPTEVDEQYLVGELGLSAGAAAVDVQSPATSAKIPFGAPQGARTPNQFGEERKAFARPKGPGRKR